MKFTMTRTALVVGSFMLATGGAYAAGTLTDPNGMTLYTFDKDAGGLSSCYDDCAKKWPAYVGKEGEELMKGWTLVKRTGGEMQMAYEGKPVYFFADDKKKGDVTGDGVGGVWHVVIE